MRLGELMANLGSGPEKGELNASWKRAARVSEKFEASVLLGAS